MALMVIIIMDKPDLVQVLVMEIKTGATLNCLDNNCDMMLKANG
jgi:hypothetical protein